MNVKIIILQTFSLLFQLIGYVLSHWKIALLIGFIIFDTGPHIRWEYAYNDVYGTRHCVSATYLGTRGFITPRYIEGCPFIVIIDASEGRML